MQDLQIISTYPCLAALVCTQPANNISPTQTQTVTATTIHTTTPPHTRYTHQGMHNTEIQVGTKLDPVFFKGVEFSSVFFSGKEFDPVFFNCAEFDPVVFNGSVLDLVFMDATFVSVFKAGYCSTVTR